MINKDDLMNQIDEDEDEDNEKQSYVIKPRARSMAQHELLTAIEVDKRSLERKAQIKKMRETKENELLAYQSVHQKSMFREVEDEENSKVF